MTVIIALIFVTILSPPLIANSLPTASARPMIPSFVKIESDISSGSLRRGETFLGLCWRRTVATRTALTIFSFLGQEFIPTLDEKNIALKVLRIPSSLRNHKRCRSRPNRRSANFRGFPMSSLRREWLRLQPIPCRSIRLTHSSSSNLKVNSQTRNF